MAEITLSKAVRSNLLNLQATAVQLGKTQERLATGLKVNSALDNPTNFFTASALNSRASDMGRLLDSVSNAVQTIAAADKGISALTKLVESAQATARQALQTAATLGGSPAVTASKTTGTLPTITASVTASGGTTNTGNISSLSITATTPEELASENTGNLSSVTITSGSPAAPATLSGVAIADGTAAASTIFTHETTLTFSDGTDTHTIFLHNNDDQNAPGGSIAIDFNGKNINTVLGEIQAALQNEGDGFASATVGISGGNLQVTLGSNVTDSLTIAGTGAAGLSIAGTDAPDPLVPSTAGTITINGESIVLADGDGLTQIRAALDAKQVDGGYTVTGTNTLTITSATGTDLVIGGNAATLAALGLSAGTTEYEAASTGNAGTITINGNNVVLTDGMNAAAVQSALTTAAGNSSGATAFSVVAGSSPGTFAITSTTTTENLVIGGNAATLAALGLSANTYNATAGVTGNAGTITINGQNVVLAAGDNAATIATKIGAAATAATTAGASTAFSVTGTTTLTLTGTNGADLVFGGNSATLAALGLSVETIDGTPAVVGGANPKRDELRIQYNTLLDQIDQLAKDTGFNGVNLLNGDNLEVLFNEDGTSKLAITGDTFNAAGLGLAALDDGDFDSNADINATLDKLKSAVDTLRTQASKFGSNLSVVETRQDFTKNMINVLQTGAANLTLADTNEEAANLLALQTRQQLSSTALSLASQADQNVLRLF